MISIIVPVYKSEKTLERCIQSVLGQTYKEWELLLILDGATEESFYIAEKWSEKDSRIHIIQQKNQGVSAARNTGIEVAAGSYIQFLDSDDYLEAEACASLLQGMEAENVDMVIAGFHHLYFSKDVVKVPKLKGKYELKDAESIFLGLYEQQMMNMPWNKLYRKKCMVQGFPLDMNLGEDLLFNLSYMQNIQSFYVLQQPIYDYIQDDRGTTLSTKKRSDRITTALCLYQKTHAFCEKVWGVDKAEDSLREQVLKSKIAVEFLDAMEGLAFEEGMTGREKRELLRQYAAAWKKMPDKTRINLSLMDYKILYPFFVKGKLGMLYLLIVLRGSLVKLIRRKACNH